MKKIFLIMAVVLMAFTSCRDKQEEMTFAFSDVDVTENSVSVTATPSDLERDYFLGVLPLSDVDGKDDAQIVSEVSEYDVYKKCKGVQIYELNDLQPETDYVALAFAWKDAEKVARYTMTTLESPEEPETPEEPEEPETPEEPEEPEDPETPEDPENPVEPEPEVLNLELSVDKNSILADGEDVATFIVKLNGDMLSENYQLLNVDNSTPINGNVFSTTEAGIYKFVALYDTVTSNEVVIEAQVVEVPDPVVKLSANKSVIRNDGMDKVTFKVLVDGVDFTSESVIFNVTENVELDGNTFASTNIGTYVFSATYNGIESEDVTVEVKETRVYSPGDLYEENGVRGVVFYVNEGGASGYIMSMDEADLKWSTVFEWANCVSGRGDWNTEDMLKLGADKYPAAKWCADHGDGWYMPSSIELNLMWEAVSDGKRIFDAEFIKLYNDKLDDPILEDYYWSSNEISEDMAELVAFMEDSVVCLDPVKTNSFRVRAIRKF